ncbi:amidohydrolase family protein [Sphingomonas cavernae]|nr:amidohydrolase family protein [Sphingomonas cavernae]
MLKKWIAAVLLVAGAINGASARENADLVIRGATIVDVAAGKLIEGHAIAVRGGDIIAVDSEKVIDRRYQPSRTIDAAGQYVMPGLWDMHVHFGGGEALIEENKALLPLYLAYGITSVRDCAADISNAVLRWRAQVAAGELVGPNIYTSGPKLEGPKPLWKGTIEVDSPAEVDAALDRLQAMRVDFVKITDNTLRPEIFLYALKAAKARGLKTSAHIPYALTVEQAVAGGLSSVEHGDYLIKAGSTEEVQISKDYAEKKLTYAQASDKLVDTFDPALARKEFRKLGSLGLYVTPTQNMGRILAYLDREDHSKDAALSLIGPGLRETYNWRVERAAKADAAAIERRHRKYELSATLLPLMRDAGISILAGTDAGYLNSFNYPGQGLHDELARFVESGLTPTEALHTSVINGPKFLGKQARYGAIAPGKAADILLLGANPLADIAATRDIRAVVRAGAVYDRATLDGLLASARENAAKPVTEIK